MVFEGGMCISGMGTINASEEMLFNHITLTNKVNYSQLTGKSLKVAIF